VQLWVGGLLLFVLHSTTQPTAQTDGGVESRCECHWRNVSQAALCEKDPQKKKLTDDDWFC